MNDLDRMQQRIDELERRLRDLEARPVQVQPYLVPQPVVIPAQPYMPQPLPWWSGKPIITCAAPAAPTPYETYMVGSDGAVAKQ